ncbi:hypothetical protein HY030_00100 [Candidatus Gottesmanbacteria bacterium]|nr:hypothetical protein [Candidatus Gottesmanbacteria bacterium]
MVQNSKKKKKNQFIDNPIEAVRELANDLGQSAKSDLISGVADSAFSQIFGSPSTSASELKPNEELNVLSQSEQGFRREEIVSFQNQRQATERDVFSYQESVQLKREIEELLKQIKLLAKSTENLTQEVSLLAMEDMPVNPGRYHVNFLEWLVRLIKSLRDKVEDSRTWLAVFHSKKKQKQYWSMFKKHGTTFGLSSERVVATQVG